MPNGEEPMVELNLAEKKGNWASKATGMTKGFDDLQ